jgi:leucine dehydrogenase
MNDLGHEELLVRTGERSGTNIVIAIHSTVLGPALGGCRMWHYPRPGDGVEDALGLARAMTLKAAAAGLDLGGGKGVICLGTGDPPAGDRRRATLLDFADAVESLEGRYITAEDVGTSATDMAVIAERTTHVVGLPAEAGGGGDPSPITARGVERAIRACAAHRFGSPDLAGLRVCVIGLGHVGSALARRLHSAGANLLACDIDPDRRAVARELGAEWIEPERGLLDECDVLAPCALGGAVNAANVDRLGCRILCGAANNMLADEGLAECLEARGITYAPDFITNAGGLIHVYAELHGHDPARIDGLVDAIGETVTRVLAEASASGITPLAAAHNLAGRRLSAARAAHAA